MKTTLFAAALVVTLTLSAAAAQKPKASQHLAGNANEGMKPAPAGIPPALCAPCLFYGGDLELSSLNAAGLSDENTVLIPGSSTYGNFNVQSSNSVTVTGILFNVQADANFNPLTATYDVRTGVTDGNGGTSIASGSGNITVASTGRNFLGLNEYSLAINLSTPLVLGPGGYWFNMTPACTNGAQDGSCSAGRFFVSNAIHRVNNVNGGRETSFQMYLNSAYFGFTYANWCDSSLGLDLQQCSGLSYGLMGTVNY
ncbi:MAG: hypothetical protein JWQ87_726 [Candidatus Sulfotelmatobacter sp.]|nr:hypothetical protein [Candidatus Sulfotelmatobacter sp.]